MSDRGIVKWFNESKGFGFIKPDDNSADLFIHFKNIVSGGGFKTLVEGQKVEYTPAKGTKGMEARDCKIISVDLMSDGGL